MEELLIKRVHLQKYLSFWSSKKYYSYSITNNEVNSSNIKWSENLFKYKHCPTNGQHAIKGKHECLADASLYNRPDI